MEASDDFGMNADLGLEQRRGCSGLLIKGGMILGVLYLFINEVKMFLALAGSVFPVLRGELTPLQDSLRAALPSILFIFANLLVNLMLFFGVYLLIARVILPVSKDKYSEVYNRLVNFTLGSRRPAAWVREGKLEQAAAEGDRGRPDLLFIDNESVVVLEDRSIQRGNGSGGANQATNPRRRRSGNSRSPVRVAGPGLAFVRGSEKILGTASLRSQFRQDREVKAFTSDGIEVSTNVSVIFTLGQPPQVIKVAYDKREDEDDSWELLRRVEVDDKTHEIRGLVDDLDDQDKQEIHAYAKSKVLDGPLPELAPQDSHVGEMPPYVYHPSYVFNAVNAKAVNLRANREEDWTELPLRVAVETFQRLIAGYTYDSLYAQGDQDDFPLLKVVKPRFAVEMRNLSVLSFQFLRPHRGQPVKPGEIINRAKFLIYPVEELCGPKVLRQRGIKILRASFSELRPVNPGIQQQRLENWQNHWQKEADQVKADHDLEVMRIRNRARADTQREMILKLSRIFENNPRSEEALALHLFQVLENAANDPNTRQLLPRDTIDMLSSLHQWLQPQQDGSGGILDVKPPPPPKSLQSGEGESL